MLGGGFLYFSKKLSEGVWASRGGVDSSSSSSSPDSSWEPPRGTALTPCALAALKPSSGTGLNFAPRILLADAWRDAANSAPTAAAAAAVAVAAVAAAAVAAPSAVATGPASQPAHRACFDQLQRDRRLHDVTFEFMLKKHVRKFCWLFPRECIGHGMGQGAGAGGIDGAECWPHGAFAYFYDTGACEHDCVFALQLVAGDEDVDFNCRVADGKK